MKLMKKFTPVDNESSTIVFLISTSGADPSMTVLDCVINDSGVFVVESDGESVVVEDIGEHFPLLDMGNSAHRDEAFSHYEEILMESGGYIPIPDKLC
jgi:hypothetical protein